MTETSRDTEVVKIRLTSDNRHGSCPSSVTYYGFSKGDCKYPDSTSNINHGTLPPIDYPTPSISHLHSFCQVKEINSLSFTYIPVTPHIAQRGPILPPGSIWSPQHHQASCSLLSSPSAPSMPSLRHPPSSNEPVASTTKAAHYVYSSMLTP